MFISHLIVWVHPHHRSYCVESSTLSHLSLKQASSVWVSHTQELCSLNTHQWWIPTNRCLIWWGPHQYGVPQIVGLWGPGLLFGGRHNLWPPTQSRPPRPTMWYGPQLVALPPLGAQWHHIISVGLQMEVDLQIVAAHHIMASQGHKVVVDT